MKMELSICLALLTSFTCTLADGKQGADDAIKLELARLKAEVQDIGRLKEEVEELRKVKTEVEHLKKLLNMERGRRSLLLPPAWTKCPNGTVQHDDSCYMVSHEIVNWPTALVYCEAYGANLAVIESEAEQSFITSYIQGLNGSDPTHIYWMGGLDALSINEWFWSKSAERFRYSHWSQGEPNNLGTKDKLEDCLSVGNSGFWNDLWCGLEHNFICEIKLNEHAVIVG